VALVLIGKVQYLPRMIEHLVPAMQMDVRSPIGASSTFRFPGTLGSLTQ
jgi:hypothetical protein